MTEQHETRWREHRLLEERLRGGTVIAIVLALSALIPILVLQDSIGPEKALGGFAGLLLFIAAFLKPEITLLVVTFFAPLWSLTFPIGSIVPGTGITPLNGLMIAVVLGTWLHRYSPTAPSAEATEVDKPLLLFLAWSAFSILTGTLFWRFDPTGIGEWLQLAAGYITYWVVRRRWHSTRLATFAVVLVLGMVVYEAYVVFQQYMEHNKGFFAWDLKSYIVGTFPQGNSNDTGAYLSAYGLVALGFFMILRKSFWRWPALMVFGIAGAATFATYSRASMLGILAGGMCMALYKQKKYVLPLFLLVAILPAILPASIAERFGNASDSSAESRKDTWTRAAIVTLRNPIVGVGWRAYSKSQQNMGFKLRDPHNMFLLVSAEQGIPGLVFFLGALIGAGKVITRVLRRKNPPFVEGLALGLFGALICFSVNNLFGSRMVYFYVVQHFWLLLGLLVVLTYTRPPDPAGTVVVEEPLPEPEPVGAGAGKPAGTRQPSPWRYRSYL